MQTETDTRERPSLEFPCAFPIKIMGLAEEDFSALVEEIIRRHVPEPDHTGISSRLSRRGRYIAVTVSITARSRAQLDAIYRELTAHESILTVL